VENFSHFRGQALHGERFLQKIDPGVQYAVAGDHIGGVTRVVYTNTQNRFGFPTGKCKRSVYFFTFFLQTLPLRTGSGKSTLLNGIAGAFFCANGHAGQVALCVLFLPCLPIGQRFTVLARRFTEEHLFNL
jgi:hypothetical protein